MSILNGLGYIGLLAAMFVPGIPIFKTRRKLAAYLMIGFASLTFVLFFVANGFSYWNAAAIISKLAELLLVIATATYLRRL